MTPTPSTSAPTRRSAAARARSSLSALPLAVALALSAPAATVVGVGAFALSAATPAFAQRALTPQIDRLEVGSDGGLAPGAQLELHLYGTPSSQAWALPHRTRTQNAATAVIASS